MQHEAKGRTARHHGSLGAPPRRDLQVHYRPRRPQEQSKNLNERATVAGAVWRSQLIDIVVGAGEGCVSSYALAVDGNELVEISAGRAYPPGLTLGDGRVALWAEGAIAMVDLATGQTARWERDEAGDVVAVYERDDQWIVVTEVTTTAWTADLSRRIGRYAHQDTVADLGWEGSDLVVADTGEEQRGCMVRHSSRSVRSRSAVAGASGLGGASVRPRSTG